MYTCALVCKHVCLCAHVCMRVTVCAPKVHVGMTVAHDAPMSMHLCPCVCCPCVCLYVPVCICAMIAYVCVMPVWGRGGGSSGVFVYKVASLFVGR